MHTEQTEQIDLSKLSAADLRKALAAKEADEKKEKTKAKELYEFERNCFVEDFVKSALQMHNALKEFKTNSFNGLNTMREKAKDYGDIRSNSKGGFSIRSNDGSKMIALRRNVVHEYDERGDLALGLIKEFLEETVKKKDKQTYRTVATLLEKNKKGDLEPSRVAALLSIKDNYTEEKWVKAMDLLTESYREREVSFNVEFFTKDEQGKDESICLTFASIGIS